MTPTEAITYLSACMLSGSLAGFLTRFLRVRG